MLNLQIGAARDRDGAQAIATREGQKGHAVYGPYEARGPGPYVVEFRIEALGTPAAARGRDPLCAVIDVTADIGRTSLARREIYLSQLGGERVRFTLPFAVEGQARLEYRVWVSGAAALLIDDHRPVASSGGDADDPLAAARFPEEEGAAVPFFVENRAGLRGMHGQGIGVAIRNGGVVLVVNGIALHARSHDDMRFIGEVFHENTYNVRSGGPVRVFDIGMNLGLTALMLAAKDEVTRVHAFEPFRNTYDRALDNLALNPALAGKIDARNVGLSDHDADGSVPVIDLGDSGAMSTVGQASGAPVHLSIRDAGATLAPLVAEAEAAGERVVVKVDCEGSEYAVFRSLEAAGLLGRIHAFMVEWHAMFDDRTREDLIGPLERAGFLVFDRAPPSGNGFFYAVRAGG